MLNFYGTMSTRAVGLSHTFGGVLFIRSKFAIDKKLGSHRFLSIADRGRFPGPSPVQDRCSNGGSLPRTSRVPCRRQCEAVYMAVRHFVRVHGRKPAPEATPEGAW